MPEVRRRRVSTWAALTALLLVPLAAAAAADRATTSAAAGVRAYPARPVRMVNPYTPGGTVDIVARAVAQRATDAWGQQVIVDNRSGGNTNIGSEIAARAVPDGYTLLMTTSTLAVNAAVHRKLAYDPVRDLTAVAIVVTTPNVLAVHPSLPVRSVKELVDLARANPGQITFASSGTGGSTFLALALFRHAAKIDLLHIPYKGGGPAIADVLGGQVKGIFNPPGGVLQQIRAGRLRGLAVTGANRTPVAPELPTIAELGYPGFEANVWYGLFAPAGTPRAVTAKWNAEINRMLAEKEPRERFLAVAMEPVGGSTAEADAYFRTEVARWAAFVRESGMNLE
jgi:tripartite-type tricarboxylate transporter receptor subunit TctC